MEPPLVVSFVSVCSWVVSLFSLRFVPLSLQIFFLVLLKSTWSWRCGGQYHWRSVISGGPLMGDRDVAEDLLCFLFFLSFQLAAGP